MRVEREGGGRRQEKGKELGCRRGAGKGVWAKNVLHEKAFRVVVGAEGEDFACAARSEGD